MAMTANNSTNEKPESLFERRPTMLIEQACGLPSLALATLSSCRV
jgi:hypothetical protein